MGRSKTTLCRNSAADAYVGTKSSFRVYSKHCMFEVSVRVGGDQTTLAERRLESMLDYVGSLLVTKIYL